MESEKETLLVVGEQTEGEDEVAKILIIGKHANVREFVAETLAGAGNLVVAVGISGFSGELLNCLEPDLILLDFHLSRMNRWRVLGSLKNSPRFPVLTYISENNEGKRKIRLEIPNCEEKSFSLETLKKKVAALRKAKMASVGLKQGIRVPFAECRRSKIEGKQVFAFQH